jgi:hypothetical protein
VGVRGNIGDVAQEEFDGWIEAPFPGIVFDNSALEERLGVAGENPGVKLFQLIRKLSLLKSGENRHGEFMDFLLSAYSSFWGRQIVCRVDLLLTGWIVVLTKWTPPSVRSLLLSYMQISRQISPSPVLSLLIEP